ncbi:MAG: DUF2188 domain-containing protein [Bacillota bacterium]
MGILSKLFGRKKKEEEAPKKEKVAKPTEPSDEVSLEEVNESLEEVNTIEKDKEVAPEPKKDVQTSKEAPKAPEKSEASKPEEKAEADAAVYDIKKHPDGWQVIKEGAKQAYRVFPYQKEAIDFAKSEDLEYRVYKSDGTLRK